MADVFFITTGRADLDRTAPPGPLLPSPAGRFSDRAQQQDCLARRDPDVLVNRKALA
jgi:hypothetical protein